MNFAKIFEKNKIIHDFFLNFQSFNQEKLGKYLLLIAIDYLSKYLKNKPFEFQHIKDLSSI